MRTPMEPVTVEGLAKMRCPAMLTIRPPDAAMDPMLTARGRFLASRASAAYTSCEAAAPPPGESTRNSTPFTRGLRSIWRIQFRVGATSMIDPRTVTRARRSPPFNKACSFPSRLRAATPTRIRTRTSSQKIKGCRLRKGRRNRAFQTGAGIWASGHAAAQGAA